MANPYEKFPQRRLNGLSREEKLDRYEPDPNSGCWLWLGAVASNGYGAVCNDEGEKGSAHRFFYSEMVGSIPGDMHVCHRCDVRICVNPAHLFLGSAAENNRDKKNKGRQVKGSGHPNATLEDWQVKDICTSDEFPHALAKRHGTSVSNVHYIRAGRGWPHIDGSRRKGSVASGARLPQSKLRERDLQPIRSLREGGLTYREIGERFGVSANTVRSVCLGESWKQAS